MYFNSMNTIYLITYLAVGYEIIGWREQAPLRGA